MTLEAELAATEAEYVKHFKPAFEVAKTALASAGYTGIDAWACAVPNGAVHMVTRATCVCRRERIGWSFACYRGEHELKNFLKSYADPKFWDMQAYNGRVGICRYCSAEIAHEKQERLNARVSRS